MSFSIQSRLRDIGIIVTEDPTNCTHLASPRIIRTQKFICAIARGPTVVNGDFILDSIAKNERLDPEDYPLRDDEGEKQLSTKLSEIITRAKRNKGRLLKDCSIYCTEHIRGGFDTFKAIAEANGGKCLLYRARAGSMTAPRAGGTDSMDEDNDDREEDRQFIYLLTGETTEEARLWPKFRQMVRDVGGVPRVVKAGWMADAALSQRVQWHSMYEMTSDDVKDGE